MVLILLTVICVGLAVFAMQRRSVGQSLCVKNSLELQNKLRRSLSQLLALNPLATTLRIERAIAKKAVLAAIATANPAAIASAKARELVVIAKQNALRARQQMILAQARWSRIETRARMWTEVRRQKGDHLLNPEPHPLALGVQARPATSLTPNYNPVVNFAKAQEARFHFRMTIHPTAVTIWIAKNPPQKIECAVTLEKKETQWTPKIVQARASLN